MFEPTPQHVKTKIDNFLANYEEGRDLIKNAESWDTPVHKIEGADESAPDNWLGVVDEVLRILAHDKYGLDTYPNNIEVIDTERMLDANAKIGLPIMYDHWTFGMAREQIDRQFKQGKMGLALEIILNTNPAIAYLMEGNSKTAQTLVIAHASYGHNNFFKKNKMFTEFSEADDILFALRQLKNSVKEAEQNYGFQRVEHLLDACHAMESHGVDRHVKQGVMSKDEKQAHAREVEQAKAQLEDPVLEATAGPAFKRVAADNDYAVHQNQLAYREENLMRFFADNAPHLEEWERDIIRQISYKAQYFYPQKQTKVMNEGWASFWHYSLMYDLEELDLIDSGMVQEFLNLHSNVIAQPDFDNQRYSGMNPYTLGLRIFEDLKRICQDPTEEDYRWFPQYAGREDWLNVLTHARDNFKDESFVLQFLSPKVIRDFSLFALRDDDEDLVYEVTGIHNDSGYQKIREAMASQYRLSEQDPYIVAGEYDYKGDRTLTLYHYQHKNRPLDMQEMDEVLRHMYQLWQHPVHLESYDENGACVNALSCPEDHTKQGRRLRPQAVRPNTP